MVRSMIAPLPATVDEIGPWLRLLAETHGAVEAARLGRMMIDRRNCAEISSATDRLLLDAVEAETGKMLVPDSVKQIGGQLPYGRWSDLADVFDMDRALLRKIMVRALEARAEL